MRKYKPEKIKIWKIAFHVKSRCAHNRLDEIRVMRFTKYNFIVFQIHKNK